jgi:hypothetical protein
MSKWIVQLFDEVPQYERSLECFLSCGAWLDACSAFTVVANPPVLFPCRLRIHDGLKNVFVSGLKNVVSLDIWAEKLLVSWPLPANYKLVNKYYII